MLSKCKFIPTRISYPFAYKLSYGLIENNPVGIHIAMFEKKRHFGSEKTYGLKYIN